MYAQCQVIFGVSVVAVKFETDEALLPNMSFKTGNVVDNIGGFGGVYTGTASNGSTDGTIEQDFKTPVVQAIKNKTNELLQAGATYASKQFPLDERQQPYLNALYAFSQLGGATPFLLNDVFLTTIDGEKYRIVDDADYIAWFNAMFARARTLQNENADLIDQVRSAANTSEAMAPIITANNART